MCQNRLEAPGAAEPADDAQVPADQKPSALSLLIRGVCGTQSPMVRATHDPVVVRPTRAPKNHQHVVPARTRNPISNARAFVRFLIMPPLVAGPTGFLARLEPDPFAVLPRPE
jgi:hypothetical protein